MSQGFTFSPSLKPVFGAGGGFGGGNPTEINRYHDFRDFVKNNIYFETNALSVELGKKNGFFLLEFAIEHVVYSRLSAFYEPIVVPICDHGSEEKAKNLEEKSLADRLKALYKPDEIVRLLSDFDFFKYMGDMDKDFDGIIQNFPCAPTDQAKIEEIKEKFLQKKSIAIQSVFEAFKEAAKNALSKGECHLKINEIMEINNQFKNIMGQIAGIQKGSETFGNEIEAFGKEIKVLYLFALARKIQSDYKTIVPDYLGPNIVFWSPPLVLPDETPFKSIENLIQEIESKMALDGIQKSALGEKTVKEIHGRLNDVIRRVHQVIFNQTSLYFEPNLKREIQSCDEKIETNENWITKLSWGVAALVVGAAILVAAFVTTALLGQIVAIAAGIILSTEIIVVVAPKIKENYNSSLRAIRTLHESRLETAKKEADLNELNTISKSLNSVFPGS